MIKISFEIIIVVIMWKSVWINEEKEEEINGEKRFLIFFFGKRLYSDIINLVEEI